MVDSALLGIREVCRQTGLSARTVRYWEELGLLPGVRRREAGRRVYDRLELIARAVNLGDVRSLITHSASTTHYSMSPEARRVAGIGDGLMRLSVGIEHVEDLWEDLNRALGR